MQMPASALKGVQRRPVGIRSLPINDGKKINRQLHTKLAPNFISYAGVFNCLIAGPRTGEGVYPGEIVEVSLNTLFSTYHAKLISSSLPSISFFFFSTQVVQILEQPADTHVWAQRFLRLSDDRGWVVENHPKVKILLPSCWFLVVTMSFFLVERSSCF